MLYNAHADKQKIEYDLAHNLIYGAIAYAEGLGLRADRDWALSKFVLAQREEVPQMEIEFGKNGRPFFISGPYDNTAMILETLNRTVGPGNFEYMAQIQPLGDFGLDENLQPKPAWNALLKTASRSRRMGTPALRITSGEMRSRR